MSEQQDKPYDGDTVRDGVTIASKTSRWVIAGAWHQWCAENQRQLIAPEERDEAFTLYLVRLIRNRMEEMNAWR